MSSLLSRATPRTSHLSLVTAEQLHAPPIREGHLISDHTQKSDAVIDFTVHAPGDASSEYSSIIVPGYGGIKPAYGRFRDALAQSLDSNTASYRQPRTMKGLRGLRLDNLLHPDKLGKQSVVAMIDMMRVQYPDKKVMLIGHSMGGPNAVEAALRRADDVEAIILLGSGGLEEGQNTIRLAKRLPAIVCNEGRTIMNMPKEDVASMFGQAAFHIARNPLRTLGEGIDIANRDLMDDELHTLRSLGVSILAVQLEFDGFFPTHIADRDAGALVDSLTVVEGVDHVAPQSHPELVAEHIASVLASERQPKLTLVN